MCERPGLVRESRSQGRSGWSLTEHGRCYECSRYPMGYFYHVDGLVQDCSNSSALAVELLQSCTKPSMYLKKDKRNVTICRYSVWKKICDESNFVDRSKALFNVASTSNLVFTSSIHCRSLFSVCFDKPEKSRVYSVEWWHRWLSAKQW